MNSPMDSDVGKVVAVPMSPPILWCVCNPGHGWGVEILTIGTREECARYMEIARSPLVRKLLPLADVQPNHPMLVTELARAAQPGKEGGTA